MAISSGPVGGFLGTQFNAIRNPPLEFISCKYLYLLGFLFQRNPLLGHQNIQQGIVIPHYFRIFSEP